MPTPTPVVHTRQLHLDALQSVTPAKMVEGKKWHQIANSSSTLLLDQKALQSRLHTILYYKRAQHNGDDDYVSTLACWLKESLNAVLPERPMFSGRLRCGKEGDNDGKLIIKCNDAGVRLVQAQAEVTMSEFLSTKESGGVKREVALLAYWEGIDDKCIDYSPLVCVQVTSFKGDGYSVGMSFSLLLGDPLFMTRFVKAWAQTHNKMLTSGALSNTTFVAIDHPSLFRSRGRNATRLRSLPLDDDSTPGNSDNKQLDGASSGDLEATKKLVGEEVMSEIVEIAFEEGNKPIHVSFHVEPEGFVQDMLRPN